MDTVLFTIGVTATIIFASALYAAAEFATMNVRHFRAGQKSATFNRVARMLESIVTDNTRFDLYIATCQLGMAVSSLLLGFYGQSTIARHLSTTLVQHGGWHEPLAVGVAVCMVLLFLALVLTVFGDLLPRLLALRYSEGIALLMVFPIRWSMLLFRPAIAIFNGTAQGILRIFNIKPAAHYGKILSPEEIERLATESAQSGLLEAGERQLLHNVFRVGEITASHVMVPRTRLVATPVETPVHTLLEMAAESGHTRIPIYRDTIDTIVGIVHLKDLFRLHTESCKKPPPSGAAHVRAILRKVLYVPETKPALALWKQLQQERSYVAIVLDEFGGTAGMVTIADLIEEIFGELRDEFDNGPPIISRGLDGGVRLHGEALIADVNEWFRLSLPDEEVNTIGGLAMATLGRLPEVGDEVEFGETRLRVEVVNGPTVVEVCLYPPSGWGEHPAEERAAEVED
jgi:CBS domain containing-hemolysin-like protein